MKNNPQKKILRQDGVPIGAEMAKKRYSSAGTTTPFLKQLILTILLFAILPVTALAAEGAPNSLYVGNQQVIVGSEITYWTTDADGNLTQSAADQSWNVKYAPSTATLTLNSATIKGDNSAIGVPYGSGIYALSSSNQSVSLTIDLIGENTITGNHGIFVDAEIYTSSHGTSASLSITGDGSLEVSGSFYGIYVKSGTGDASLNINDASVVAKATQTYSGSYAGVYVMSSASATDSPNISLSVDGGSLTASGTEGNDGIQFYVGDSKATNATTSLTVSDNAIVDARTGGIRASRISETLPTPTPTGGNSSGIVFDGTEGTVYGDVTLQENLVIGEGESLTIPQGASLDCNEKLTNNGTINVESGGNLNGEPGGTVVSAPTIGTQPASQTVTEGNTATFTVAATGGNLSYQWQQSTDSGQSWTDIEDATDATYAIEATTTSMSGNQYRCVVSNSAGSIPSKAAILTLKKVPTASVFVFSTPDPDWIYNNSKFDLSSLIKVADGVTGMGTFTVSSWQGTDKVDPINAGTYTVKVSVEEGTSYTAATDLTSDDWVFKIKKANPIYTIPTGLIATYGETLADVELPEGWAWEDESLSVGNAEKQPTFKATFTPEDTKNYNIVENIDLTVMVGKANPTPAETPSSYTATVGDRLSSIKLPEGWTWEDDPSTILDEEDSYVFVAIFTPEDTDNYNSIRQVVMITVVWPEPEPEPEPEPTYYRVDLRPVEGATVILSVDEVEEGGTLTFTIEIAEGYVADDLMVTVSQGIGKAVEVKPDEAGVYTVKEVDGLVTITVYGVTEEPATAIERVETLRIYAAEGILHVETPTRQRVTIVSMAGALIADGEQEGARIYRDLNAGVYIVRVGDYATKVRVE